MSTDDVEFTRAADEPSEPAQHSQAQTEESSDATAPTTAAAAPASASSVVSPLLASSLLAPTAPAPRSVSLFSSLNARASFVPASARAVSGSPPLFASEEGGEAISSLSDRSSSEPEDDSSGFSSSSGSSPGSGLFSSSSEEEEQEGSAAAVTSHHFPALHSSWREGANAAPLDQQQPFAHMLRTYQAQMKHAGDAAAANASPAARLQPSGPMPVPLTVANLRQLNAAYGVNPHHHSHPHLGDGDECSCTGSGSSAECSCTDSSICSCVCSLGEECLCCNEDLLSDATAEDDEYMLGEQLLVVDTRNTLVAVLSNLVATTFMVDPIFNRLSKLLGRTWHLVPPLIRPIDADTVGMDMLKQRQQAQAQNGVQQGRTRTYTQMIRDSAARILSMR